MVRGGFRIKNMGRILSNGIGQYVTLLPPTLCAIIGNYQLYKLSDTSRQGDILVAANGLAA
ncbi:hypothetical protein KIPB_015419, partial [Kipferlia bialata]|eukprot:g15419.t1